MRRTTHTATFGRAGFTLIEILVASTILSLVTAMLFGAYTGVISASSYMRGQAEMANTERFIIRGLTEDLVSATTFENNPYGLFVGVDGGNGERQTDEIQFTSLGRKFVIPGTGSDQAVISWFVNKQPGRRLYSLMRREYANVYETYTRGNDTGGIEVTDRLVSFKVVYLSGREWNDSYDSAINAQPPRAVKVVFTLEDDHGRTVERSATIAIGGRL